MFNVAGKGETEKGRKELNKTRIQKDGSIIRNIVLIVESMDLLVDPFEFSMDDRINICSGK